MSAHSASGIEMGIALGPQGAPTLIIMLGGEEPGDTAWFALTDPEDVLEFADGLTHMAEHLRAALQAWRN